MESAEEDQKGGLNLYLTMKGTVDEPIIKYDKLSVKEKIKEDLKEEKKELKEILKDEFSNKDNGRKRWKEEEEEELEFIDWD